MTTQDAKHRLSDWYRQWRWPLRKFLGRSSVPQADVEDVAQEVFLRLMRYERAQIVEHPQAYLFKIASNVAAEWAIRARQRQPHEPIWLATLTAIEQPEAEVVREAAQDQLERALEKLTPRQRQVLKLFFADGLAQAEIALQLGETRRSVRRQLAKSYEKLRAELDSNLLETLTHGRE